MHLRTLLFVASALLSTAYAVPITPEGQSLTTRFDAESEDLFERERSHSRQSSHRDSDDDDSDFLNDYVAKYIPKPPPNNNMHKKPCDEQEAKLIAEEEKKTEAKVAKALREEREGLTNVLAAHPH